MRNLAIRLPVRLPEIPARHTKHHEGIELQSSTNPQANHIPRCIPLPKHRTRDNPSNRPKSNLQRTRRTPLTLHTNIIRLIRQNGRHIALPAHDAQEYAEVAHAAVGRVGDDHQPRQADDTLDGDDGGPQVVLVAQPGETEGCDHGDDGGRGRERVGDAGGVAEANEDDGGEVAG
jgi:hypothetical protein